jgi:hypothetical protein
MAMPQNDWTPAKLAASLRKWTGWQIALDAADMDAADMIEALAAGELADHEHHAIKPEMVLTD